MLDIYKEYFEAPFVQDSAKFYQREATTFINENPINEYLRWVAQCLVDEENRIKSYLHPSTLEPILKILDNVLIRDNLDRILDEAEFLFNNSRNQGEHVSIIHSPIIALRIRFCALMPKQINVARSVL
ncbi:unnamed protein product [Rotaria sp. Silwood1]|nr:unnamed protein product [Rotaria sp. Silwood1]